jgi:hypothetical protein
LQFNYLKPSSTALVVEAKRRIANMRALLIYLLFIPLFLTAQKRVPLPHGMVFGEKPEVVNLQQATNIQPYLGNRSRISAVIIGRVVKVTKPQGGWFDMDAGQGKVIAVHFKNYGINLPVELKGKEVIIAGTLTRQFEADDKQKYAGDNPATHRTLVNPKELLFEATGLYVNR